MDHGWNRGLAAGALVVAALVLSAVPRRVLPPVSEPLEAPVRMDEGWTADAGALPVLKAVLSRIPPPGEMQKKGGCDPDLGEAELNGGCWMKTDVPTPCPRGKLWEHEGKCWRPIPKVVRAPTSGGGRAGGVAEEP